MPVDLNKNFFDGTDAEIASGTQVFSGVINTDFALYGLTNAQATSYSILSGQYFAAWQAATNPATRTHGTVAAKNAAKIALKAAAKDLASIINGTPTVTDQMKIDVGLRVSDGRTPWPVPTVAPKIGISNYGGNTLKVILSDANVQKRGKPAFVKGAAVYYWVGEETPNENTPWVTFGNTGRTLFNMEFPSSLPQGTKVWVIAAWFNGRGQFGPSCQPVSTLLLGQSTFQQGNLKLAA